MNKINLALALLLVYPIICFSNGLGIEKGMPFEKARKTLIKDHWQPFNVHEGEHYEYVGTENNLRKKGFKEVESCAMDKPFCVFNYKRQDKCVRLITFGEQIMSMKVSQWSFDCSDPSGYS